jgi:hypothetical protein
MSQPYLAEIQDDGTLRIRARSGKEVDRGNDLSLDGLDPEAFDIDAIRKDLAGEVARVQREVDVEEVRRIEAEADEDVEGNEESEELVRIALAEHWDPLVNAGSSILDVDTDSAVDWVPGAVGIIRKRERQAWVANFGQGKTQALSHFIVQVIEAGGRVIHIDAENDKREMAERIKPIAEAWGVDIRRRHAYHDNIDMLTKLEEAGLLIPALPIADLLVIDSLSRVLSLLGYDENSNPDVIRFMTDIVDVIAKQAGLAVLILDNTGKSGKDARGAVSKAATVEAVYEVSGGTKVSETLHGTLKLKLVRTRSGKLAQLVQAGSGGGSWDRLTPAKESEAATADDKVAGERVVIKSFLWDRRDKEFTADAVAAATAMHPKTAARRLAEIKQEGFVTCEKRGRTNYWAAVSQ